MKAASLVLLLLVAYATTVTASGEVSCSRDDGHTLTLGPCYWVDAGRYYDLTDVTTLTYSNGVFAFTGPGGERVNVTVSVTLRGGQTYDLATLENNRMYARGDIARGRTWKFGI